MPNRQRSAFFRTVPFFISAILFRVRNSFRFTPLLLVACASALIARPQLSEPVGRAATQSSPQQVQQPAPGPPQAVPAQTGSQQITPPTPTHAGPVIVLDPAHGGIDNGARGQSGVVEKDLVLLFARTARLALEREGFRVVMTRNDDSDPSYDDRAALANSYRDVIFVSFHISSTGALHTARAYFYQFPDIIPTTAGNTSVPSTPSRPARAPGLVAWEEAQRPYTDASHRLADALQADLAQRFPGSPSASSAVAVRVLRSVGAPAIAIEISSVTVSDPVELVAMAAPISTAIVHAIVASRPPAGSTAAPEAR